MKYVPPLDERAQLSGPGRARRAGAALHRLVDLVSHRSGLALAAMTDAAITLPQVLLLSHVERRGTASPSELAEAMHVSLPGVSQMIERLVQQGLLDRTEHPLDRRRKSLAATPRARAFMRKLSAARARDYQVGLAAVPLPLLAQMTTLIERAVSEMEGPAIAGARRRTRALPEAR